jgi:hypothetical protein
MKIGVIGTGMVSQAISGKLAELGHQVMVGARSADSESLAAFGDVAGIETGSFADAAAFGELVFSLVGGEHTLEALDAAGAQNLAGKTLIDTSNQLDHSQGFPPRCSASEENCLAVKIQQRFPDTHVVKSLNTMNSGVMINPASVPGDHVVFVSGDDEGAKAQAKSLLAEFGWRDVQIVDLGGIASAASVEMLMPLWLNVVIARGGFDAGPFNLAINS